MDLIIHSYGYSKLIFEVLNGIAMFRNSLFYETVINTVALAVGVYYSWHMALARVDGIWRQYILKIFGMVVFINALLLPKVSMLVKDHVEKSFYKVDNIPLAFALPVGVIENFGHLLTMGFEQVFSQVGSNSSNMYYHYGTVFGARLAKEVAEAKIRDPEVVSNMRNFIERCVVLPAMIGHQFAKEELMATTDIWGLVSRNAGTFTRVDMSINGKRQVPAPTCKEAVSYFEVKFAKEEQGIINALSRKFRGAGEKAEYNAGLRQLNNSITASISALYGGEHKVDTILKHNMMINAINNYRAGKYASAKAAMQQEAGGFISGDLAEKTLTGSLAVMKVFVYGSFIFLLPILIVSGGISKYKSWIVMALSLALWPPLFSMLNMIIDYAYEPANIVSYSSWATEKQKFDSIASTAANLTLLIPVLAFWVTRMGEGGFMHLAGSIMATANAVTGAVAGEKASGSRNWDNESIDNSSRNNSNFGKTNHSFEYVSGENGWNLADGSMSRITAGGTQVITGGAGRSGSSGEATYRSEDAVNATLDEHLSSQQALAQSKTAQLSEAKSKTFAKQAAYLENIAQHTRTGNGYNIDTSTEEGRAVKQTLTEIDRLEKTNGYGWRQNAEASLRAHAKLGFDVAGSGAGVTTEGGVSASNSSDQGLSEHNTTTRDNNVDDSYNLVSRALNSESWAKENGFDQNMNNEVRESYEETQRLEQDVAARWEDVDTYSKALNYAKTHGAVSGKDMYQDVLEAYAKESGKSIEDARKDVERRSPAVMRVFNRLADNEASQLVASIRRGKADVSEAVGDQRLSDFTERHEGKVTGDIGNKVNQTASDQGFNGKEIKDNIAGREESTKDRYNNLKKRADDDYHGIKGYIQIQEKDKKSLVQKYEEDRIGNGLMAKGVGGATNALTLGHAGWGIGYTGDRLNTDQHDLSDILPEYNYYTGKPRDTGKQEAEQQIVPKERDK